MQSLMPRWAWQTAADDVGSRVQPRAQVAPVSLRRLGRCRSRLPRPGGKGRPTGAASPTWHRRSSRSNTAHPARQGQQAADPPFFGFSNDKKAAARAASLYSPRSCSQEAQWRLGPMAAKAWQGSRCPQKAPRACKLKLKLSRGVISLSYRPHDMHQPDQTPILHMDQGVMSSRGRRTRQNTPINLEEASDEALLSLRLSDLPLRLDGTLVSRRIARLHRELTARKIIALPHVWLSEEFFTPDKTLGFAVPFYLAHRRLMHLERSQMLECEGASEAECRRILRHEAGHALDEAYGLHARPRYRQLFGNPGKPYPSSYSPRVDSRAHVVNLSGWYAQSHPVEDFAETFAVWLNPYVDWRTNYKTWPALAKLEYVDEVMREI
ncbi:MAG: hypothetical protein EHM67_15400, partial [Hyphomicrobiaceae bacterium]